MLSMSRFRYRRAVCFETSRKRIYMFELLFIGTQGYLIMLFHEMDSELDFMVCSAKI